MQCLRDAQLDGRLRPGMVVVELTSGNMGIGLAVACSIMGCRMIAVMSEGNSPERRQLLAAYGAEIELVSQARRGRPVGSAARIWLSWNGGLGFVDELGAWRPDQFATRRTRAPMSWEQDRSSGSSRVVASAHSSPSSALAARSSALRER